LLSGRSISVNKASSADAQLIVQALRERHPAAAHACWALLAGGQSAANNNGEPGGTAGRPMLDVLRQQELEGVLATVVRHFGGIRRGAGGRGTGAGLHRRRCTGAGWSRHGCSRAPVALDLPGCPTRSRDGRGMSLSWARPCCWRPCTATSSRSACACAKRKPQPCGHDLTKVAKVGWFS